MTSPTDNSKRKGAPYIPSYMDLTNGPEPCVVCGDAATGYHYRCMTCEGCKGFFRRTIQKELLYQCKWANGCVIDKTTRNQCQQCRFVKCLSVGMATDLVLNEKQRKAKRKLIEDNRERRKDAPDVQTTSVGGEVHDMTDADRQLVRDVAAAYEKTSLPHSNNYCIPECDTSENNLSKADPEVWYQLAKVMTPSIVKVVDFAKGIPDFIGLNVEDQILLLKSCCMEIMCLRTARKYDPQLQVLSLHNGIKIQRQRSLKGWGTLATLIEPIFEFATSLSKLKLDETETALLAAVLLMQSDRPGLKDPEAVEKLQDAILGAYKRYIAEKRPEQPVHWAKILMKVTDLRTISSRYAERVLCIKLDSSGEIPPLFLEMFNDGESNNDGETCAASSTITSSVITSSILTSPADTASSVDVSPSINGLTSLSQCSISSRNGMNGVTLSNDSSIENSTSNGAHSSSQIATSPSKMATSCIVDNIENGNGIENWNNSQLHIAYDSSSSNESSISNGFASTSHQNGASLSPSSNVGDVSDYPQSEPLNTRLDGITEMNDVVKGTADIHNGFILKNDQTFPRNGYATNAMPNNMKHLTNTTNSNGNSPYNLTASNYRNGFTEQLNQFQGKFARNHSSGFIPSVSITDHESQHDTLPTTINESNQSLLGKRSSSYLDDVDSPLTKRSSSNGSGISSLSTDSNDKDKTESELNSDEGYQTSEKPQSSDMEMSLNRVYGNHSSVEYDNSNTISFADNNEAYIPRVNGDFSRVNGLNCVASPHALSTDIRRPSTDYVSNTGAFRRYVNSLQSYSTNANVLNNVRRDQLLSNDTGAATSSKTMSSLQLASTPVAIDSHNDSLMSLSSNGSFITSPNNDIVSPNERNGVSRTSLSPRHYDTSHGIDNRDRPVPQNGVVSPTYLKTIQNGAITDIAIHGIMPVLNGANKHSRVVNAHVDTGDYINPLTGGMRLLKGVNGVSPNGLIPHINGAPHINGVVSNGTPHINGVTSNGIPHVNGAASNGTPHINGVASYIPSGPSPYKSMCHNGMIYTNVQCENVSNR